MIKQLSPATVPFNLLNNS